MTNIRSIVYAACLITSLALTSRPASAGILCNTLGSGCTTLGPGNAYDGTNGYFVDGSTFHNQVIANSFTLGAGATVGDAAVFLGFVIPGETAAVLGGVLASRGRVSLPLLIVVVVVAAVTGPLVGYEIGRHLGSRVGAGPRAE